MLFQASSIRCPCIDYFFLFGWVLDVGLVAAVPATLIIWGPLSLVARLLGTSLIIRVVLRLAAFAVASLGSGEARGKVEAASVGNRRLGLGLGKRCLAVGSADWDVVIGTARLARSWRVCAVGAGTLAIGRSPVGALVGSRCAQW